MDSRPVPRLWATPDRLNGIKVFYAADENYQWVAQLIRRPEAPGWFVWLTETRRVIKDETGAPRYFPKLDDAVIALQAALTTTRLAQEPSPTQEGEPSP